MSHLTFFSQALQTDEAVQSLAPGGVLKVVVSFQLRPIQCGHRNLGLID